MHQAHQAHRGYRWLRVAPATPPSSGALGTVQLRDGLGRELRKSNRVIRDPRPLDHTGGVRAACGESDHESERTHDERK